MPFPQAQPIDKRRNALDELVKSIKNGKPAFAAVSRKTGISKSTLKRWWIHYQLEQHEQLKTKLEKAITTILERMEKLAEETNNLKELAPVAKMLSELLHQFGENEEENEEWG